MTAGRVVEAAAHSGRSCILHFDPAGIDCCCGDPATSLAAGIARLARLGSCKTCCQHGGSAEYATMFWRALARSDAPEGIPASRALGVGWQSTWRKRSGLRECTVWTRGCCAGLSGISHMAGSFISGFDVVLAQRG